MTMLPLLRRRGPMPAFAAGFVGNLPAGWTHTRASAAWRFNAVGQLEQLGNDTPRLNYDVNSAMSLGYLHEEQRTQRLSYCRDFTQAVWTKTNCSVLANATGLDGISSSACTMTASAANATLLQGRSLSSALRAGSVYIKRGSGTGGVDLTLDGGTSWTSVSGLSSSQWVRAAISQTVVNPSFGIRLQTSGDSVIIDGAQVEDGPYPSSLIVTAGSADVARAADSMTIPLGNWFNHAEGTLCAEAVAPQGVNSTSGNYVVAQIDNGASSANRHALARSNSSKMVGFTLVASSTTGFCTCSSWGDLQTVKMAYAYKTDDFVGISSGSTGLVADSAGAIPASGLTTLRIGNLAGGVTFNGHIRRIAYHSRRLTNAELTGSIA